jgi:hypothetical protein
MLKVLISRITGNLRTGTHFTDKRVNQDLTRKLSVFVDLPSGAT